MDGRETDQDRENCAPRPSLSNVLVQNAKLLFTAASIAPLVPLLLLPMGMHLCSPCIHSSTPRLHATCRNPPSICNHKEAARLDFACCLVHRWTRQVYFLGSNPSFVLCVPPPYCPYRPMWHFSSIPLPPIPPHPFVCCIDNISLLRMIRIALQSI